MRPEVLYPLFSSVSSLPGIGPRLSVLYERLAGKHCIDLCWHLPSGLIDRRFSCPILDAPNGRIVTLRVTVDAHLSPDSPKRPYRVRCSDNSGLLHLIYFHARGDWLKKLLPIGEERIVSGLVERFNDEIQMPHPDWVVPVCEAATVMIVEPVYPLTAGLANKGVTKAVHLALGHVPSLPEWQDERFIRQKGWSSWREALCSVHRPERESDLSALAQPRCRLAYDELLANQLALALVRAQQRKQRGRAIVACDDLRQQVLSALPFILTAAQKRSLAEIDRDMKAPIRMLRLLQGDVGSGKTIVAFLAMLTVVEASGQAALMAPTEILARQHHATLEPLARQAGVRIELFTGRDKGKGRQTILDNLARGETAIIVGTHALFQDQVVFHDLRLAVIDEQHRFGVRQRLDLTSKGQDVDVLAMTATPIPRTLMLTAYGDMDVSRLDEKPQGRQPIATSVIPLSRLDDVIAGLRRAIHEGARIYWVCPLIEESEESDLAAVEERHELLRACLGERVGLIHGRMKASDKDGVMAAFMSGDYDILVATTVIEVGVNIPEATVMVIEHAERFGLAQLHQLRGRVGRGDRLSRCLLLYASPLSSMAKARLKIIRETEDGFLIAEEDLRLRGAGEALGTRQSGLPQFRLADLSVHGDLLATACNDVRLIMEKDPHLQTARGQALRTLLYLFERDAVVKTLQSG